MSKFRLPRGDGDQLVKPTTGVAITRGDLAAIRWGVLYACIAEAPLAPALAGDIGRAII